MMQPWLKFRDTYEFVTGTGEQTVEGLCGSRQPEDLRDPQKVGASSPEYSGAQMPVRISRVVRAANFRLPYMPRISARIGHLQQDQHPAPSLVLAQEFIP